MSNLEKTFPSESINLQDLDLSNPKKNIKQNDKKSKYSLMISLIGFIVIVLITIIVNIRIKINTKSFTKIYYSSNNKRQLYEEDFETMGILHKIAEKYKTVSIVGMAKNAGKTTALNYFIEQAMDESLKLGITSTGRDGETQDVVTGTEKPKVYLDEGTLVSVPANLFDLADAGLEIVKKTKYGSAMGNILICRVKDAGYVQIAGPAINADQKKLCQEMLDLGCELVIIDGAIDRRTIGSPETSDAIILSTGAVLSRKISKVIQETAHIVHLYRTPELESGIYREEIEKNIESNEVMIINDKAEIKKLNLTSALGGSKEINENIKNDTVYVFIPGAFTNSVLEAINLKKLKQVTFILKDPTKIFINSFDWDNYCKKGFKIKVLKNIVIAALTVNPWSPRGYSFDNTVLLNEMKKNIPDLPIIDVRMAN